jgi:hypothetical protein
VDAQCLPGAAACAPRGGGGGTASSSGPNLPVGPPPVCPFNFQADYDQPGEGSMPDVIKFQIDIDGTWFDIYNPDAPDPEERDAWINLEPRARLNEFSGQIEIIGHGSAVMDCDDALRIFEDHTNIRAVDLSGALVNGWFSYVGFTAAFHNYIQ